MERLRHLITRRPALREGALVGGGLLAYFLSRGRIEDRHAAAQRNAAALVELERRLGLLVEARVNRWTVRSRPRIRAANLVYFWAHAPLIVAGGLWLYRYRPAVYRVTRDAFAVSAVIALVCYRLYPVAPPRLTEGHEFVDTMQQHSAVSYQAQSLGPFVNPYAAVPSLHFGWSFLLSVALVMAAPRRAWSWAAALLQPPAMQWAIVASANHWVLDAAAGLVVCMAGLGAAVARARRVRRRWRDPEARQ